MIEPHGGKLVDRVADRPHSAQLRDAIDEQPVIDLSLAELQDVINIAHGRFSPLTGFVSRNDFVKIIHDMALEDGTPWSIPVTLDVDSEKASELVPGQKAGLRGPDGSLVGVIDVEEVYGYNGAETTRLIYGTDDRGHPGVRKFLDQSEFFVGGDVLLFERRRHGRADLLPAETRVLFRKKGWETVVGFQTRNAPHRAHEYIQKSALELVDGLLVQPKVGYKKQGDYRDAVILESYRRLIDEYYVDDQVALSMFPSQMRYAGPREAIFDAIVRKNQGCTHFVVGRDHAGVQDYYDGFDAHRIFEEIVDLGIEMLFYHYSFYCERCDGMTSEKICPHGEGDHVTPSGTRIRTLIQNGSTPDPRMMREEVADYILSVDEPFVSADDATAEGRTDEHASTGNET